MSTKSCLALVNQVRYKVLKIINDKDLKEH